METRHSEAKNRPATAQVRRHAGQRGGQHRDLDSDRRGGIPEGQFQQFALYLGPLPDADTLALPTTQTFADGTSEAWAEQTNGGDKPQFPVPTVTIGKKTEGAMLPVIAWTALGLSVVGLGLGAFAIDRASRRTAGGDPSGAPALAGNPEVD